MCWKICTLTQRRYAIAVDNTSDVFINNIKIKANIHITQLSNRAKLMTALPSNCNGIDHAIASGEIHKLCALDHSFLGRADSHA